MISEEEAETRATKPFLRRIPRDIRKSQREIAEKSRESVSSGME
jgi:hypothetical protein